MIQPAKSPATYQDVLDAPEHMVAELIDGQLFLQPRPAKPHTQTASSLGAQLHVAFQVGQGGPGGWWILDEPELHLDAQVVVPDVAGWKKSEVAEFDRTLAYYTEVPTWVSEVLSPRTEGLDRIKKLRIYHEAGIPFVWLVHPERHTLEVFEREKGGYLLAETHVDEVTVSARPFTAFGLDLATLWL